MSRKRGSGIIFFFIFLFFYSSFIRASCSIGATPLGAGAEAKPGQEVVVTWNFYNLYGDRITHITLSRISGPDWDIRYDPPLHEEEYDISGIIINQTENLAMENNPVVLTIPENPPEGISYVKHPNKEGYIPVKQIKIYLKIPEDAELWKNYRFVFEAKGECFAEPGAVIPGIATQLKVDITPTREFYEKQVSEEKKQGFFSMTGAIIGGNGTTVIFIATTVIFVIAFLFALIRRKKKI